VTAEIWVARRPPRFPTPTTGGAVCRRRSVRTLGLLASVLLSAQPNLKAATEGGTKFVDGRRGTGQSTDYRTPSLRSSKRNRDQRLRFDVSALLGEALCRARLRPTPGIARCLIYDVALLVTSSLYTAIKRPEGPENLTPRSLSWVLRF
jgi:hypothetical protein